MRRAEQDAFMDGVLYMMKLHKWPLFDEVLAEAKGRYPDYPPPSSEEIEAGKRKQIPYD